MQNDILQYLSVYTIHISYTHIDDVNISLSYIRSNYLTRKESDNMHFCISDIIILQMYIVIL